MRTWRDSATVWENALSVTGGNTVAHRYLGAALIGRGLTDAALPHLAEAVRLDPHWFIPHYDYGQALLQHGDARAASAQFQEAIQCRPTYADAYFGLGQTFVRMGQPEDAVAPTQKALDLGLSGQNSVTAKTLLAAVSQSPATSSPTAR